MADQNTALPIRSEADGTDERLHMKIVDGTNPAVNQASVDSDKNLHVELHGDDEGGTDRVVALSESGNVALNGDYDISDNTNPSSSALIAHDRSATHDRTTQNQRPTAVAGAADSVCLDISLHDEAGQPYSINNPMPVSLEESEGDEIVDYQTSASVAKDASVEHDYTVTALKTFIGDSCWVSASGKIKLQVQVETGVGTDTYTTKFVAFNSTANTNIEVDFRKRIKVAAGVNIRLLITNLDNQTQDVYSTLLGIEKS